jgi:hypothetical protein
MSGKLNRRNVRQLRAGITFQQYVRFVMTGLRRIMIAVGNTALSPHPHCERSEAIQNLPTEGFWIASSQGLLAMTVLRELRSQ